MKVDSMSGKMPTPLFNLVKVLVSRPRIFEWPVFDQLACNLNSFVKPTTD